MRSKQGALTGLFSLQFLGVLLIVGEPFMPSWTLFYIPRLVVYRLWVFAFSLVVFAVPAPHSKSISNLFVQGELAASLWSFFASHLNISISQAQSLEQRLESWWTDTLCSQYSFLRNSVALFILWEVWKDRNSIIHDNVKLNIVKTRQTIWKWLLDTVVLFHPAGELPLELEGNKVADSLASFAHAHRDSMVFYSEDKFPTCCKKFQSCGPARTVSDLNKDAGASLPRLKCRKEASAQQTMNLWVPCLVRRPVPSSKQAGRRGTAILGLTKAGNGSAAKEVISYPLFGLSKDREARLLSVMTFPVNFHYSIVTEKPVEIDCFALLYIEESCRE
ncbi:hypothetical protein L1987_88786 [Smallanthus sonchifolius]|nr:hypothetical protein L1987_88786 [Smallanthus sonchifolius]